MGAVVWALPVLVGLVLPLWEDDLPVEVSLSLVIAGLLLKAWQVHAERPGAWFPLLVTGSTAFALTFSVGSGYSDLLRFLIGVAVAIGLGFWAWRARSYVVAATAVGYLAAVWYVQRLSMPVEDFGWFAYAPINDVSSFDALVTVDASATQPYPELVIVAGAVLAYARLGRVRPWHVMAIVGLLGSLWHYGALVLVVAAVVVAAYDVNARRPGAWYPLLLVGIGLVVWPVVEWVAAPRWTDPGPDGYYTTLTAVEVTAAVSVSRVDYDELFLAFVVAVGLAVWSWRRKSPIMLLTAAVLLGVVWLRTASVRPELVVLAGAAVALATAPAGTPDRPLAA